MGLSRFLRGTQFHKETVPGLDFLNQYNLEKIEGGGSG